MEPPQQKQAVQQAKPKWLRKLERESWQAELIISGLAIIGSLQLPGLLDRVETYCLLHLDRDTLFICYIAALYWRILFSGLIVLFVFHFIVRALWIGLVGLNSVYPGGFRPNERFSEHFQENLRREYGDVDGLIAQLDRLGSGLFGIGFGIAGVFFNFGLLGSIVVVLHAWLIGRGVEPDRLLLYFALLFAPVLLASLVAMALHTKRLRDTAFARRYLWPLSKWQSRFTYPTARRYIVTSLNIVTSYYADSKAFVWYFLLGMLAMIGLGMSTSVNSPNIRFFIDAVYHRMANDSSLVTPDFVEGSDYRNIYYRPVLPRPEDVTPAALSLWVPLPEREYRFMDRNCSEAEVTRGEEEDRTTFRSRQRARTLRCAEAYFTVTVNGRTVEPIAYKREYKENEAGEQFGLRVYLENLALHGGLNVLGVTARYPHEDNGAPREAYSLLHYRPN